MDWVGPRGTREEELGEVVKLVNYVFRESSNYLPTMQEEFSFLFRPENRENLRIMLVGRKVVSHLGIFFQEIIIRGTRLKVGSIGAVATHPRHRGKGLATQLLKDAIEKLSRDGADLMLVSGDRGLYRRAGCSPVGKMYQFIISSFQLKHFQRQDVKAFSYSEENLEKLIRIYQQEPVRFHRPRNNFRIYLNVSRLLKERYSLEKLFFFQETLLITEGEEPVGYLIFRPLRTEKQIEIIEYAGTRQALPGSLYHIFQNYPGYNLLFPVPEYDRELLLILKRENIPFNITACPPGHTLRIINFPQLMGKIQPLMEEWWGENHFAFRWDERTGQFSDVASLTGAIFGVPDCQETPFYLRREFFPLPFPNPGLNYV